jgi:hypothetical protein
MSDEMKSVDVNCRTSKSSFLIWVERPTLMKLHLSITYVAYQSLRLNRFSQAGMPCHDEQSVERPRLWLTVQAKRLQSNGESITYLSSLTRCNSNRHD